MLVYIFLVLQELDGVFFGFEVLDGGEVWDCSVAFGRGEGYVVFGGEDELRIRKFSLACVSIATLNRLEAVTY
jgi:hypothetical protein